MISGAKFSRTVQMAI